MKREVSDDRNLFDEEAWLISLYVFINSAIPPP